MDIQGGLGNQMFQIAAAYAYARQQGGDLKILKKLVSPENRPVYWDTALHRLQPYLVDTTPPNLTDVYEPGPLTYFDIGPLPPQGVNLKYFFQSSKFYRTDEIKEEIQNLIQMI